MEKEWHMKVLYIEDELSKNIPRITRLIGKHLSPKQVQTLGDLEKDESGYVATSEEIKHIVEETHVIAVEYRFPDALRKVMRHPEPYTLFIIDRNLAGSEYTLEEVQSIDPEYNEELADYYSEREGDYLLLKLGKCGYGELINNAYFLTAYHPARDELLGSQALSAFIDLQRFKQKNFFEKAGDVTPLQEKIDTVLTKGG